MSHDDVMQLRGSYQAWALGFTSALLMSAGFITFTMPAQADQAIAASPAEAKVNNRISKRIKNPAIGPDLAMVVMDAQTQRIVSSLNADKPMLPASNMKIITATNALSTMQPGQAFTTKVLAGSSPGSIILQGGGDPLLSAANLRALADSTAALIDHSQPLIVNTDVNLFPKETNGPGWTKGYVPSVVSPVSALAMLGDYSKTPVVHAVDVFIKELEAKGLSAARGSELDASADAAQLASISPHTTADAVHRMLLDSENNVAENLFRHVALTTNYPPTWQGASTAAIANLNALGINTAGLRIADGSGVSRSDRLNALALAAVLRLAIVGDPARFAAMFDPGSLPTSGIDGTLDSKFHRYSSRPSSCARGAIRAKTGTLHDTIALSGTVRDADGALKVFSFLVNERPTSVSPLRTRQAIDGLASTITGCW